jgi:hypothetical protein
MIQFVALGPPHDDGQVVYEIRRDGDPGYGYIVCRPELICAIAAALDVLHDMDRIAHPELHPEVER